eukprot:TRINITY_DN5195_c0_g1_i1.p1 TRINITY_DN5195_c0_g1~~TRINITY_DN5195_c0_g1_i1.p1  ORF type:complete len:300 (+),score=117.52 TRINITY_DN5195_c0_g1_i1:61-960(+)
MGSQGRTRTVPYSQHVVQALFDRYDNADQDALDVGYFCHGLFGLKKVMAANAACRDILNLVRERILARGGKNGVRSVTRILRLMDDNGDRNLDREELRTGMRDYGIDMNDDELDIVMHHFDSDDSQKISVTEFLVGLRGKMSPERIQVVKLAFTRLDKSGDRSVTMRELMNVYHTEEHPDVLSGEKTAEEVLAEFAADWDRNGDAVITEQEFINYYKDISAGIDDDAYFELMLRNAWHLAGGVGQAANTVNRRVLVHHLDGTQTIECLLDDLSCGDDIDLIKAQLRKQGVTDILRVRLN